MDNIVLNIRVAGCPNKCFHCHCCGGGNARAFFDVDTIIKTASFFREELKKQVWVLLLDEQTFYPQFFELVAALESEGFMRETPQKLLVTNGWGLRHVPGFMDRLPNHYAMVMPTLFGIGETHDAHTGKKGSYEDIIEASKACVAKGIDIQWHLQWSRLNTDDMNTLFELAEGMGITKRFISAEYIFSGYFLPGEAEKYLPVSDDLHKLKYEVHEHKEGQLKTASQFVEDIKNGVVFTVDKAPLNHIYLDDKLNVYPLSHLFEKFCMGNLNDSPGKIIEQLKTGNGLPEAIIAKRNQDFAEIVLTHADTAANQLYTPRSLFDRLCLEKMQERIG